MPEGGTWKEHAIYDLMIGDDRHPVGLQRHERPGVSSSAPKGAVL